MVLAGTHPWPVQAKSHDHVALTLCDELDVKSKDEGLSAFAEVISDFGTLFALTFREHHR